MEVAMGRQLQIQKLDKQERWVGPGSKTPETALLSFELSR